MNEPDAKQLLEIRRLFWKRLAICIGIIVFIHAVPKSSAPRNTFRLLCTLVYLGAVLVLLWQLLKPRREYMHLLYAWRFADCPSAIVRLSRRYLYSLDQLCRVLCCIALAFVGSSAILVLQGWFRGLSALAPLANMAWWLSLLTLGGVILFGGFMFSEVGQHYRLLKTELSVGDYRLRTTADLAGSASEAQEPGTPVQVSGELTFIAGEQTWHWEQLYKNVVVMGQTGTGKTLCVLNALLEGLVASANNPKMAPSGLILDPKGDFRGKLEVLCRKYGRQDDLLIVDPQRQSESIVWNPLDSRDDELELSSRFVAVLQALGMKSEDTSFWIDSARTFIRHAIKLIRLTNPPGAPPSLTEIGQLARSFDAIVARTDRLDLIDEECDDCLEFFANDWLPKADETRTSVQSYITNMVDPFSLRPYRDMFSGRSTRSTEQMVGEGRILYVHMPVADKEAMARTIGTFVKLAFFREVLKAVNKPRPSFFLCDEFQVYFTTARGQGDADFFERSRQSRHVNIIATQNLPALLKCSPTDRNPIMNLMGNCATKIFLRNTDPETNKWGSELFGQELVAMGSSSAGGSQGHFKAGAQTGNASDQYDSTVRQERFTELAIPDRSTGVDYCEAIIHRGALARLERRPANSRWRVHPIIES